MYMFEFAPFNKRKAKDKKETYNAFYLFIWLWKFEKCACQGLYICEIFLC